MKKYYYLFIAFAMALVMASCAKPGAKTPFLEVNPEAMSFGAEGGSNAAEVNTGEPSWDVSVSGDASWCTAQKDGELVRVTVAPNSGTDSRSAVVEVKAGSLSKEITVTQDALVEELSLGDSELRFGYEGGSDQTSIMTNISQLEVESGAEWCTVSVEESTLVVNVSENKEAVERTTEVTVKGGSAEAVLNVIQAAAPEQDKHMRVGLPVDFSDNNVIRVMDGDVKVAEICREYISQEGAMMDIIYPVKDGKADLASGIELATGGTVVWNVEENTCEYTPGTGSLETVWILEDGSLAVDGQEGGREAVLEPDLIVDVRGSSSEVYRTVKIGVQYWMAENLRAEKYADGNPISTIWEGDTDGAYIYLYDNPQDNKELLGALYSGYAVANPSGLAPKGWLVPDNDDWNALLTYVGKSDAGAKMKSVQYWKSNPGTNASGFDARPAQSYSTATDFLDAALETWFWSTDMVEDILTGENSQYYVRITDINNKVVFNTDSMFGSFHSPAFGHSVRCIKE